jgi:hypothetical protein
MNIKSGNIRVFIALAERLHTCNYASPDDVFEEDDPARTEEETTYKIGKFCIRKVYINPSSSQLGDNIIYILTSCVFGTSMIYLHGRSSSPSWGEIFSSL